MSYLNKIRGKESPNTEPPVAPPSTTEGNGVPASVGGNGVANQATTNVASEVVSEPDVEAPPARSLPVQLFGFRFNVPGRLILLLVPFLWSSFGICVKWLYRLDWAVSPTLFNAVRLTLAATAVMPPLFRELGAKRKEPSKNDMKTVLFAGAELGLWTIIVNVLQSYGLKYTSASRGAFLGQLSTVIVPIVAFLTGMEASLGWHICAASILAVCGVGLLTLGDVASPFNLNGDAVMLSTAFVTAVFVLRSKVHADKAESGPLVPIKVISQAVFALAFLGITSGPSLTGAGLASLSSMFAGATPLMIVLNIGIIIWAGLFVSVGSTVLQMRGQALVSASEAIVIFSLTPLCAALQAIPLGERFGLKGIAGASLILISTLLASRSDSKPQRTKK